MKELGRRVKIVSCAVLAKFAQSNVRHSHTVLSHHKDS